VLSWLKDAKIDTVLNDPGKPWQNGTNESFNGKFRDECLGMEWFRNRMEAKAVIEVWRVHYNEDRPHSSIAYLCGTRTWIPRATTSGGYMERTTPSIPWATTSYDSLCCIN